MLFCAVLSGGCVVCHDKCCSSSCYQRLKVASNDCKCAPDGDTEDVGRVVRSLCLNFTGAVVCHAEQPVVAVSDLSKTFAYNSSSFPAKGYFSCSHYNKFYSFSEIMTFILWWQTENKGLTCSVFGGIMEYKIKIGGVRPWERNGTKKKTCPSP